MYTVSPLRRIELVAASISSTTRRPSWPSVSRRLAVLDAIDEVLALDAQRFGDGELRRPHVAGAVADAHLLDLLGSSVKLTPLS